MISVDEREEQALPIGIFGRMWMAWFCLVGSKLLLVKSCFRFHIAMASTKASSRLNFLMRTRIVLAISATVLSAVGECYYKVTAEALRVCGELVRVVRPNIEVSDFDFKPYIHSIYMAILSRLTNQYQYQAFAVIVASPLHLDLSCVLEHVIVELAAFLHKANRALRKATLGTLNTLIVAYGDKIGSTAYEVIIVELSTLIRFAYGGSCPGTLLYLDVRQEVQTLSALQNFFATLVYSANTSFDVLLESLLSTAKPSPQSGGIAKQALFSIAQCVVVLCLAAGDHKCSSTVKMLTEILKDDSTSNSCNQIVMLNLVFIFFRPNNTLPCYQVFTRETVVVAVKYSIVERPEKIDAVLYPEISSFLMLIKDQDRHVRLAAVLALSIAGHNKPNLIKGLLPEVLPLLYDQTIIKVLLMCTVSSKVAWDVVKVGNKFL
ncbi:unnamed protein product [Lactuca virosa]|uniref:Clathrin/coatomer adaptor adaptin-like N-terminal domain-containing protein n=1 Tax=Lactuca virosa TaxID=75947 RepID=A0AAU9PM10_9ASTR|nr:unnamed protein product [Lactuca virosa]